MCNTEFNVRGVKPCSRVDVHRRLDAGGFVALRYTSARRRRRIAANNRHRVPCCRSNAFRSKFEYLLRGEFGRSLRQDTSSCCVPRFMQLTTRKQNNEEEGLLEISSSLPKSKAWRIHWLLWGPIPDSAFDRAILRWCCFDPPSSRRGTIIYNAQWVRMLLSPDFPSSGSATFFCCFCT